MDQGKKLQLKLMRMLPMVLLAAFAVYCSLLVVSCARMGSPDGGWYDDTPPRVVSTSPADKATNVKAKRISINFNEYIKIEDAQNKVIVSPPQLELPEIKDAGKRIIVELNDSLKENTTYTIDFSDAITDNNEGNPLGNYTYSFSTGQQIDTLEVSGYVLDAENLEPVKGILVGLYPADSSRVALMDSAFCTMNSTTPFVRVSRTDSRGYFVIKGVAPGSYVAGALKDADGDFVYSQKSEMMAFNYDLFTPSCKPDIRQDTIWLDSLHIDNILRVGYTHFLPDDITLMAFTAPQTDRHLLKSERLDPQKFTLYFTYGDSLLPVLQGLNFDADSALLVQPSAKLDTIHYWLLDTALVNQDTLRIQLQYHDTDTAGILQLRTDTLELLPKVSYEKRLKERQKEYEKWLKEQEKKRKRDEPYDSIMPVSPLNIKLNNISQLDPDQTPSIESPVPIHHCDTAGIHLYVKVDTLWYQEPYRLENDLTKITLFAEWKPDTEYSLEIDSAAFVSIYGLVNNATKAGIKLRDLDSYSTLIVKLTGIPSSPPGSLSEEDGGWIVQLLNKSEAVTKQAPLNKDDQVVFYYVKPGDYYLRAFHDRNGNGKWDTGDYFANQQPEDVYYYPEATQCKEKWDITREWNLKSTPRYRQKPGAILKQKPEKEKKRQNRNAERAKQLGKQYIQDKTGVRL